jgi:serine protease
LKKNIRNLIAGSLSIAVTAAVSALAAGPTSGEAPMASGLSIATGSSAAASAGANAAGRKVLLPNRPTQSSFDQIIVKYRDGASARSSQAALMDAVNAAAIRAGVAGMKASANGVSSALSLQHVRKLSVGADAIKLSRGLSQTETNALLAELRADPSVQYAQPDYVKHRTDFVPNDPRLDLQWHYTHPATGIKAPTAWDASTGDGVVVAVLDTGYLDHADLTGNIIPGYDFVSDPGFAGDGDGRDADAHDPGDWVDGETSSFHGTHVAGTVAAVTNNGVGVAGVAFNAKVQPVRVLGHGGGMSSDIADAITWASGGTVAGVPDNINPAEVINLSLGGAGACSEDPMTQEAIDGAVGRGVTVVVAAGNSNSNAADFTPASCKGVIAVGASGIDGARSYFSNYGATVTVTAPGGNATSSTDADDRWIWSLGNSGTQAPEPSPAGDRLAGFIGTSMASPHVAGVVALMQSAANVAGRPALTPAQVKTVLRSTATPFTVAPPANRTQGPGIVDAAAAVAAAVQDIPDDSGILLDSRIALPEQTGAAGDTLVYKIVVPVGVASINLRTYGGTGNVSLYVAYERTPSAADFDRKSTKSGNGEAVVITRPPAGTYYMSVVGEAAFAGLYVMGAY